jgi:hypothetical protein
MQSGANLPCLRLSLRLSAMTGNHSTHMGVSSQARWGEYDARNVACLDPFFHCDAQQCEVQEISTRFDCVGPAYYWQSDLRDYTDLYIQANCTQRSWMETHGRRNEGKKLRSNAVLTTSVVYSMQSLIQSGFLPNHGQN